MTPEETITHLRALLARTYRAAIKPAWEDGECLNEVLPDVHWEGIAMPEMIADGQAQEPHGFKAVATCAKHGVIRSECIECSEAEAAVREMEGRGDG
jgi:hypothetical protein